MVQYLLCHRPVDKGWDGCQRRGGGGGGGGYLGDKMREPIIGCQASAVPSLLKNRIHPVSGAEAGDLHEGVVDGGCGVGYVSVCVVM